LGKQEKLKGGGHGTTGKRANSHATPIGGENLYHLDGERGEKAMTQRRRGGETQEVDICKDGGRRKDDAADLKRETNPQAQCDDTWGQGEFGKWGSALGQASNEKQGKKGLAGKSQKRKDPGARGTVRRKKGI